jgi:hypothetical protein
MASDARPETLEYRDKPPLSETDEPASVSQDNGSKELINASGHKQELERNFSLINLCGVAITTGNTWTAIGGSVVWKTRCEILLLLHRAED